MIKPFPPRWRDPAVWIDAAYDPHIRGIALQALLLIAVALLAITIGLNTAANLKAQNVASGFDFLSRTAGFDVSQALVPYSSESSYAQAFWVGLSNTLLVAALGIVFATVVGFALGIARVSENWLASRLALAYVEIVRNVPLLLQLLVWYVAVLRSLPAPSAAFHLPGGGVLDVRGLHVPRLAFEHGWLVALTLTLSIVGAVLLLRDARSLRARGLARSRSVIRATWAGVVVVPLIALVLAGSTMHATYPTLGRFNHDGGVSIEPEFLALLVGLSIYTAAFIAEIVRAGLLGVPEGQREAAAALGLNRSQALRLVILPQALRIIIPPLTNQYLNLTKNSSLAVAIGYPDLVSVFAGTVLNQTGQAVEVIAITMGVYLVISLATAMFMNWLNTRTGWRER
ncbi:amino acid ABC transporter permease [Hyphomicrobium sp.]|uniref:amino acid ABC transporter permease n=1 Tax=Hyphomicrobium sp. TaxID=82 RepID=UPI003F6FBFE1